MARGSREAAVVSCTSRLKPIKRPDLVEWLRCKLMPYHQTAIECLPCGHEWVAVYECNPLYFQCPACQRVEGVRMDE